jgi:uncharacterized NAD(P)/FAD-binding protein YdhS
VGAGLAGTATAIRLLRFAREPLEVVLLERRQEYRYAGAAYHRDGNPWQHVFNIQAGRMAVFREDTDDFVGWANREADRQDWPEEWADHVFADHDPAPRRIYQDYLADRLAEAAREAYPGVDLVEMDGEAIDVQPHGDCLEVVLREARRATLLAAQVVLATGLEVKVPAFAADVLTHEAFVREPYSADGVRKLHGVHGGATVVVVGSVLSAYDTAALLLRQGHTGKIYLVSGSGSTLRAYPHDHRHGVVELPPPSLIGESYQGRDVLLSRVRSEWEAACATVRREHPDMDQSIVSERVAKAWEAHLPEILERIPSPDLRGLLAEFGTVIATFRVGALPYTTRVVEEAMSAANGAVELIVGRINHIAQGDHGGLVVTIVERGSERTLAADLAVSNFGREPDYEKADSELWRNLLRKGIAVAHRRTGRGLEVGVQGTLLGSDGVGSDRLWAVGVLREGDEIVRNGRLGAFTFNLAAIKNHSIAVAAGILERLEATGDAAAADPTTYDTLASSLDEDAARSLEEAVRLEVWRMAAKARRDREVIDGQLDSCLQMTSAASPLEVRRLVNREAVRRMTDVSVTPRQLRRMLGLADE